ncbi:MAG: hypothetical protein JRN20_22845 [Nitrososphaerota archaeon]|nr:hypothetical protein [Nitrososphaerota archaeon]
MSFRSLSSFGKRQEYVAIAKLLEKGYDVYQTLVDDQGIDCIVRKIVKKEPRYIDVQIKARSSDCKPYDAGRFAAMKIETPRKNYLFMFYAAQLGDYWIIPSLDLVNRLASRNKRGANVGKYHVLLSGLQKRKPVVNHRFDSYRNEKGFEVLERTFTNL